MRVHRNLNRGTWSITEPGERVRHAEAVTLARVTFRVSLAGRARVLARKCRAVHAWAIGTQTTETPAGPLVRVSYNPYRADSFTRTDTGAPIHSAAFVVFTAAGEALAQLEG